MDLDRLETFAKILYEDTCVEHRWPLDLDPWSRLNGTKRVVYMQRALRILQAVDNVEALRFLS